MAATKLFCLVAAPASFRVVRPAEAGANLATAGIGLFTDFTQPRQEEFSMDEESVRAQNH